MLHTRYKALRKVTVSPVPSLTMIAGKNGSGKTQLLSLLASGEGKELRSAMGIADTSEDTELAPRTILRDWTSILAPKWESYEPQKAANLRQAIIRTYEETAAWLTTQLERFALLNSLGLRWSEVAHWQEDDISKRIEDANTARLIRNFLIRADRDLEHFR